MFQDITLSMRLHSRTEIEQFSDQKVLHGETVKVIIEVLGMTFYRLNVSIGTMMRNFLVQYIRSKI